LETPTDFYYDFKGKGIIAFSDPAGAKACLAFASILKINNIDVTFEIFSNKQYDFYNNWDIEISVISNPNVIDFSKYSWIFTGTSHPKSSQLFELKLLQKALLKQINTYSFVDHWTNFLIRFQDENGSCYFPNSILVLDDYAIELAVKDGLPRNNMRKIENPYLTYIKNYWKSDISCAEFRLNFNVPANKTIILFAPDPISLRNDNSTMGFDEITVLKELLFILKKKPDLFLIISLHPLQKTEQIESILIDFNIGNVFIDPKKINNLDVISHSDIIIGFYSNFLLEADKLEKKVYRYFPENAEKDYLKHLNFGIKINNLNFLIDEY
jgi:CDP-glycerol glycerophosphotransferase (TagB/SpsB family)